MTAMVLESAGVEGETAVDGEGGAGDVGGCVGGEIEGEFGDLFGLAHAVQGDFVEKGLVFFGIGLYVGVDRGIDGSGSNIVDSDVVRGQFEADGAGEHAHAAFSAAIWDVLWHGDVFVHG